MLDFEWERGRGGDFELWMLDFEWERGRGGEGVRG
jgi:hypothetical protein